MINMKMSKEEAKEYTQPSATDAPAYPYGLCISLNDDDLEKLGLKDKPPAVGSVVTITAKATVTSCGMRQEQGGDMESRCELQITDMEMSDGATGAQTLYKNMNP